MSTSSAMTVLERWGRMGGAAGVAFVALTLIGGVVQHDVPVYTDGPSVIKEWFADNSDRYFVRWCLIVLGVFFFLVFLAVLVAFARADDAHGPWRWLALLAGSLVVVAAQVSSAFRPNAGAPRGRCFG